MKKDSVIIGGLLILLFAVVAGGSFLQKRMGERQEEGEDILPPSFSLPFSFHFQIEGVLEETENSELSSSPYWWLNSGGRLILLHGLGKTIQGELPVESPWRTEYAHTNPIDTDNGRKPQNLFRLYTKGISQDVREQVYFRITALNVSDSPNRDLSNGVFLINRFQDSDDLYYAGVRVDGTVVIKKKKNGIYYTLAQRAYYGADAPYLRDINPNLIPGQKWIGLRTEVKNNSDGSVDIKLFLDRDQKNNWQLALETKDSGKIGETPLREPGRTGIRTDFMDVEFDEYSLESI